MEQKKYFKKLLKVPQLNTLTFQKSQQLLLQIYQDGHVCDIDTPQTFETVRVECHSCHPLSMLSVKFCCH